MTATPSSAVCLRRCWLTALLVAVASASRAAADGDVLHFRNGDALHGRLVAVRSDERLLWGLPGTNAPAEFQTRALLAIELAPRPVDTQSVTVVRLTNDDALRGRVVALDRQHCVLETTWAGPLTIPRAMLQRLDLGSRVERILLDGIANWDGWERNGAAPAWALRDGVMTMRNPGTAGRLLPPTDALRLDFDLEWREYPYLQIGLFTDNLHQPLGGTGAYCLQLSGNTVQFMRCVKGSFTAVGGAINFENWQPSDQARFTLLVDRPRKYFRIFVDGQPAAQWVESRDWAGKGHGLVFQPQNANPMRLRRLRAVEWDGLPDADVGRPAGGQDLVVFRNGDVISGRLQAIADGIAALVTDYGTLPVPCDRLAQARLGTNDFGRARRQVNDVRAVLQDGSTVTLALEQLDEHELSGASENWGRARIRRDALRELRFGLYAPAPTAKEE